MGYEVVDPKYDDILTCQVTTPVIGRHYILPYIFTRCRSDFIFISKRGIIRR